MKTLFILLFSIVSVAAMAQDINVTVKMNGNKNKDLIIDGKTYTLVPSEENINRQEVVIPNLKAGQHKMQFSRVNANKKITKSTKTFNLRQGYDMVITVNGNGGVSLKETPAATTTSSTATGTVTPMTDAKFNTLLTSVKNQWRNSSKISAISKAFKTKGNYFTTDQAGRLITLVTGEKERLALSKESYRIITDQSEFGAMMELLSTQESKDDLAAYVYNSNGINIYTSTSTNAAKLAMTTTRFNSLLQAVKNEWRSSSKKTMITEAFKDQNNYFTTDQTGQLIQQLSSEADRLEVAKLSYRAVIDPVNFKDIHELLNSQASRDELVNYVYQYNGGTINNNSTTTRTAMSQSDFNVLYRQVQDQWLPYGKLNQLTEIFNNTSYYFTTSQARQMVLLVSNEDNRMQLAKLVYRNITDPASFNQIYDVFSTQAKRDELDAYVKNYKR